MKAMKLIEDTGVEFDDEMFQAAVAGVATYAPALAPLTWEQFTNMQNWWLIPDDQGGVSKVEWTLHRSREQTVKMNIWYREDLRGGLAPMPHNHPWDSFTSRILLGGYEEDRYHLDAGNVVDNLGVRHESPNANTVDHGVYHEVREVFEPGRTITLMSCGAGKQGDWGYLDLDTAEHKTLQPVKNFQAYFDALNRHHR